ncbi:surf-like protein [Dispira parvispora]|uniref:SURF1-like protein n=1 Tax=Dispira parvispora TaxID=1520584 RepID=A0A9W8E6A5_9FUNG|nr:surf-like protein [Dispira parvispora]
MSPLHFTGRNLWLRTLEMRFTSRVLGSNGFTQLTPPSPLSTWVKQKPWSSVGPTSSLFRPSRLYVTERVFKRASSSDNRLFNRVLLGFIPLICVGLGTWQVYRLRWKEDLIAKVDDRLTQPIAALPKGVDPSTFISDWEYRRVLLVGKYHHEQEMLLGPRAYEGENGFLVITPLEREDGSKVLVKRGWIDKKMADPRSRPESRGTDLYTIYGMVRRGEQANNFTPPNKPDQNEWYVADVNEMAAHTGSMPLLIEEIYDPKSTYPSKMLISKGIPLGRQATVEIRNNHLEYVVTWYALAAATAVMFGLLVRRKPPSTLSAAALRQRTKV